MGTRGAVRRGWTMSLVGVVLALCLAAAPAAAARLPSLGQAATQQLSRLPTSRLDGFLSQVNEQTRGALPSITVRAVLHDLLGGRGLPVGTLLRWLWARLAGEVAAGSALLGQLLLLAAASAVLEQLARAVTEREEVSRLAFAVVAMALIVVAVRSFTLGLSAARGAVTALVEVMQSALPLLTVLLASAGAVTTAGLFHPLMLLALNGIALTTAHVVLPLLYVGTLVEVVAKATGYRFFPLGSLVRQAGMWVLGGLLTVLLALVSVYGAAAPVADGLLLRSGKFVANAFVPVVGKMFSDAAELVLGSSLLLKQAVGVAAFLGILLLVSAPLFKVVAFMLVFRGAAVFTGILGNSPLVDVLSTMGSGLSLVAVALATVAIMFLIFLTVLLAAGSPGVLP